MSFDIPLYLPSTGKNKDLSKKYLLLYKNEQEDNKNMNKLSKEI